uniref:Uncharacterized protein n=1 Tax=Cacopsylla melanoneura TaxID=428564 RepID=A0A8D8TLX9_9HEMI
MVIVFHLNFYVTRGTNAMTIQTRKLVSPTLVTVNEALYAPTTSIASLSDGYVTELVTVRTVRTKGIVLPTVRKVWMKGIVRPPKLDLLLVTNTSSNARTGRVVSILPRCVMAGPIVKTRVMSRVFHLILLYHGGVLLIGSFVTVENVCR